MMARFTEGLRKLRHLIGDRRGIAATEFALIAPVFILVLMVVFDLAHMAYARSVFEGAVERAAREASLGNGDEEAADELVESLIGPVLPGMAMVATRKSYFDLNDVGRPEQFSDGNSNDVCDNGESFVDENRSGAWESDIGSAGNGGSNDVVVYTVRATYNPVFRVPFIPAAWGERTLEATAIKKNQPFGNQQDYATTAGTCID